MWLRLRSCIAKPGKVDERMLAAVERRARDADAAVDGGTATALPAREGGPGRIDKS